MKRPTGTFAMFVALLAVGLANVGSADDKEKSKNDAKTEKRLSALEARVDGIEGHLKRIDGRLEKGHAELMAAIKNQSGAHDKGGDKKPTDKKPTEKKVVEQKSPDKKPGDAAKNTPKPDPKFQKSSEAPTEIASRSNQPGKGLRTNESSGQPAGEIDLTCKCTDSATKSRSNRESANRSATQARSAGQTTTETRSYIYVPRSMLQNLNIESSSTRSASSLLRSETDPCAIPVVDPCATVTTTDESRSLLRFSAPAATTTTFRSAPLITTNSRSFPLVTRSDFAPSVNVARSDFAPATSAAPVSSYVVTSLPWSTAHIRGANSIVTVPSQKRPYVLTPEEAAYWGVTESAVGAGSEPQRSFTRRVYYGPYVR